MGNCKSRRQSDANCTADKSDQEKQTLDGDNSGDVIHEQISASNSTNLNSLNALESPAKDSKKSYVKSERNGKHNKRDKTANDAVINTTRAEVQSLLEGIDSFQGTSQNDRDYKFLDEMLTRCILRLDTIECNSSRDRTNRKEAIRGVNDAISMLERKLEINSDIRDVQINLKGNDE